MKNILLITSLYPANDVKIINSTEVCHYFAKEWVSFGYNVKVIYTYRLYPWFYYPILSIGAKKLGNHFDAAILSKRLSKITKYDYEGIPVIRIPIKKSKPHGKFKKIAIKNAVDKLIDILKEENYKPDYILGHFLNPALGVISQLKNFFPETKTALTLHGKISKDPICNLWNNIDLVGFRSFPIKNSFEKTYGVMKPTFMCPSGIPDEILINSQKQITEVRNFVFVGNFMRRKYPSCIIDAVSNIYKDEPFSINYVGDGNGRKLIEKRAKMCNCSDKVRFTGRIPRNRVTIEVDNSEVLIMISEKETFGLVYLEAMARGCLVIASRDEGMDGYIIDGVNGFLCKAGDAKELATVVKKIKTMSLTELQLISYNGLETARNLTDKKVAADYIYNIENL